MSRSRRRKKRRMRGCHPSCFICNPGDRRRRLRDAAELLAILDDAGLSRPRRGHKS